MAARITISVQEADFDLGAEQKALPPDPSAGAMAAFVGTVRADGTGFEALTLEHYPGMTERQLENITAKADTRWSLADIRIIHRTGRLSVGDQIVLVITRSRHRGDAFQAAEFIMDFLKTDAPFWKRQTDGTTDTWVDARDSDTTARDRWGE